MTTPTGGPALETRVFQFLVIAVSLALTALTWACVLMQGGAP